MSHFEGARIRQARLSAGYRVVIHIFWGNFGARRKIVGSSDRI
jgi:hypothetical protein